MKLSDAVSLYLTLRDQKEAISRQAKADIKAVTDKMDKIEAQVLKLFNTTGQESSRTDAGTAYISTRTSVTVADKGAFMDFIKDKQEWGLLEVRPSKEAVEVFRESHDDTLPPGINYSTERVVNIRRSP